MRNCLLLSSWLILGACVCAQVGPVDPPDHPVTLGVDMAGSWHLLNSEIEPWAHEPFYDALAELGATHAGVHLFPVTTGGATTNSLATGLKIARIDAGMRAHGLTYTLNNEDANFTATREVDPGVNEYDTSAGEHRWDIRMSWLASTIPPLRPESALLGVIYDEPVHMQIGSNQVVFDFDDPDFVPNSFDVPYLVSTHGLTVEEAYEALAERCTEIASGHYEGSVRPFTEQLWPDMFHIFARAGWGITPKLLKENFSPLIMAVALGAAIQYPEQTTLWANVDMHFVFTYPGHSPAAVRSALLLGYWTGADGLYVENLDFSGGPGGEPGPRHPEASPTGALLAWDGPSSWTLTSHGHVVRDFYRDYVPAHPRRVDWRNYRPRVAIVRLPDGDWGMENTFFRNRLLGNRDAPSDEVSKEWLKVWNVLTHGTTDPRAISYFNWNAYPEAQTEYIGRVFTPLDSVAVFDHTVWGKPMNSVQCFVVCGSALSEITFLELKRRAASGARVIIARRLFDRHATELPQGDWHVVDSFEPEAIAPLLAPHLGPAGKSIFTFEDQIVEFSAPEALDTMEVKVFDRTRIPEYEAALLGGGADPDFADLNGDGVFDIADLIALQRRFE